MQLNSPDFAPDGHFPIRSTSGSLLAVALAACLTFMVSHSPAQTKLPVGTGICGNQSSFQFPLWNDGAGWNTPGLYGSIQLADIDGDGQDELIGKGPAGVEVWHWEPNGQAWIKMVAGTPVVASTDIIMTADVDGDKQAEIIQITPTAGSGPSVANVWHYDSPTQAWRLIPQLSLTLFRDFAATGVLSPLVTFADLNQSGRLQMIYLRRVQSGSAEEMIPYVYQLNAAGTGWTLLFSGAYVIVGSAASQQVLVGDVNGDGRPDIVVENNGQNLAFFIQQQNSGSQISFAGEVEPLPNNQTFAPHFALASLQVKDGGTDEVVVVPQGGNGLPGGNIKSFFYVYHAPLQSALANTNYSGAVVPAYSDPIQYSTLQKGNSGVASGLPSSVDTVLMLQGDGFDEFGVAPAIGATSSGQLNTVSNTPFISPTRFGSPGNYTTIQTGKVNTASGASISIVIARDGSGVHTLLASPSVCLTQVPGFQLPLLPAGHYYPEFTTSGQQSAYGALSLLASTDATSDIRTEYTNQDVDLGAFANAIGNATYQANSSYSAADFSLVKNQLLAELAAGAGVRSYFTNSGTYTAQLYMDENNYLNTAVTALNLPADTPPQSAAGAFFTALIDQIVGSFFTFVGSNSNAQKSIGLGATSANNISELASIFGDIVSDAGDIDATANASSLANGTLDVENTITNWANATASQNANAETATLSNWDILQTLYQKILTAPSAQTAAVFEQGEQAAAKSFGLGTWQTLAPSVWEIYNITDCAPGSCFNSPDESIATGSYPYAFYGNAPISDNGGCCGNTNYVVYPELSSTGGFAGAHSPVAQDTIQQVMSLGAQWQDIIGQRNGWQNVGYDNGGGGATQTTQGFPTPPDPPVTITFPIVGAPYTLQIQPTSGVSTGQLNLSCPALGTQPIYGQSTPALSAFPNALSFTLLDSYTNGIPNATVQISGTGLSPAVQTVLTDTNGLGVVNLLANATVTTPYNVTVAVTSPAGVAGNPSGCLTQNYQLANTPADPGATGLPAFQPVLSVTNKTGPANNRVWTIDLYDSSLSATAISITQATVKQMNGSACGALGVASFNPSIGSFSGQPNNFFATVTSNFGTCGGLTFFSLTVSGTATIISSDGTSYSVPFSNITAPKQLP